MSEKYQRSPKEQIWRELRMLRRDLEGLKRWRDEPDDDERMSDERRQSEFLRDLAKSQA